MINSGLTWVKKDYHWLILLILSGGIFMRMVYLGQYPAGLHQDEAYAGYEAYAMLHTGMDSHGYAHPVYFISWGHGMNALYSYITMPFIKLGGLSVFTIRLPQALIGCVTLVVFYDFIRILRGRENAVIGLFLLAVNPWHIMLSRWGLEANIAPFFLLLGMYFLTKAFLGKEKNYIPAFLSFGLTLYCYAIMWLFVPMILLFLLVYVVYYKKVRIGRCLIIGVVMLGVLATPLFLFFLINKGYLREINAAWFSIPKMSSMRDGEVSLSCLKENWKSLFRVLLFQNDGMLHNSPSVGNYYYCSIPFILLGGGASLWQFVMNLKKRNFAIADTMILWGIAAVAVGGMVSEVNVNRINCIHLPIIYFGAYGCMFFIQKVGKWLYAPLAVLYVVCFGFFCAEYFSEEHTNFYYGYEDALDYAESITAGEIGTVMIRYSNLLMHSQMLPQEYLPEMNGAKNFDMVGKFGRYITEPSSQDMREDVVYVVPKQVEEEYLQPDFTVEFDNGYYVVITKE